MDQRQCEYREQRSYPSVCNSDSGALQVNMMQGKVDMSFRVKGSRGELSLAVVEWKGKLLLTDALFCAVQIRAKRTLLRFGEIKRSPTRHCDSSSSLTPIKKPSLSWKIDTHLQ
jgi:hypothetical protein